MKTWMVMALLITFSIWESPDGKWTRQGRGSSEAQGDAQAAALQYCQAGTVRMTLWHEGARVLVTCEAK